MNNAKFLISVLILVTLMVTPNSVYASNNSFNLNPLEILNKTFSNTTGLPKLPDLNLRSLLPGSTDVDGGINFGKFLNVDNLSGKDLGSAIKAVLVLAINLFLIVIQTVASILKALLPFLQ